MARFCRGAAVADTPEGAIRCGGTGIHGSAFVDLRIHGSVTWSALDWNPDADAAVNRRWHTATYASSRDEVLIYGGEGLSGNCFGDLWSMQMRGNTATIRKLTCRGSEGTRKQHSAAWCENLKALVVAGGVADSGKLLASVIYFDCAAGLWRTLLPALPCGLRGHQLLATGQALYIVGGDRGTQHQSTALFALDVGPDCPPGVKWEHVGTIDPASGRAFHGAAMTEQMTLTIAGGIGTGRPRRHARLLGRPRHPATTVRSAGGETHENTPVPFTRCTLLRGGAEAVHCDTGETAEISARETPDDDTWTPPGAELQRHPYYRYLPRKNATATSYAPVRTTRAHHCHG